MARNLPEFNDFVAAKREFERHLNALNEQLAQQFHDGSLAADSVLGELLTAAKTIKVDDATVAAAQRRAAIGNPPGKKGSLGDAINWECMLAAFPDSRDLHLVTGDSDFVSRMSSDHVSTYLAEEWRIRQLVESPSFAETHRAVSALASYTDYSEQQAQELLEAAVMNSQIDCPGSRRTRVLHRARRAIWRPARRHDASAVCRKVRTRRRVGPIGRVGRSVTSRPTSARSRPSRPTASPVQYRGDRFKAKKQPANRVVS
jgi:hypothetical protein